MGAAHAADQSRSIAPQVRPPSDAAPHDPTKPEAVGISNRWGRTNWHVEAAFSGVVVLDPPDADLPANRRAAGRGADDLMDPVTICARPVSRRHHHTGLPPPPKRNRSGAGKHPQAVSGFVSRSNAIYATAIRLRQLKRRGPTLKISL